MAVAEVSEEMKDRVEGKMEWEGIDGYFLGGWAEEDFEGTPLASLLRAYLDAREELLSLMVDMGIEV